MKTAVRLVYRHEKSDKLVWFVSSEAAQTYADLMARKPIILSAKLV